MGGTNQQARVCEGCYLVSPRRPKRLLQCNTYLRCLEGRRGHTDFWCIDPGTVLDRDQVRQELLSHAGAVESLGFVSLNHQDPDVVGNFPSLVDDNPSLTTLVTEDAWRLIRHLGARPKQVHFANAMEGSVFRFPGGHTIRTVPTPFCHFRGAMAFYDPESRTLFSGDLFGGLNDPGRVQLWGEEADWPGIAMFHQIYMPTRVAVAHAIKQIRALDPPVEIIAPQHGFALRGDFMHRVLERLETLPVGLDRLSSELDAHYLPAYREVFHELIRLAGQELGPLEVLRRLRAMPPEHPLAACVRVAGDQVDLRTKGTTALALLVDLLASDQPPDFRNRIRHAALRQCQDRDAPLPPIALGIEDAPSTEWIG